MPLGGLLGSGIGLVREGYEARKASKSRERDVAIAPPSPAQPAIAPSDAPPSYDASEAGRNHNGGSNHSETDDSDCTDDDEEMWELDEAVDLNTVAGQHQQSIDEGQGQAGIDQIVRTFTREHPPPTYTVNAPRAKLPASVIIPQRRPHANTRGFVRAYAPVLADCGIDQETFMDFMDSFESARKTSPVFDVINIAGNAVGMVPSPIAMAVSIVAITTARTGKEVEGRHKTNNFLDQMNHELFMPHGLYCLIMKYKAGNFPDSEPMDINKVINKYSEPAGSKTKDTARNLRLKSGITHGEAEMPEAAPLIFPALEAAPDQKKSAWSKGSDFVADYYDKRARAKYGAENPNSALHVTGEEQFASRYSDPNSTANTGGILGLVSGGHLQHSARHQKRRRRFGERTGRLTSSKPQRETMRSRYGPATFVKKVITPDVLYFMITNLPSQEEVDMELARLRTHDGAGHTSTAPGVERSPAVPGASENKGDIQTSKS